MKSITEKFYTGCKKIENQDELEKYKNKGRKLAKRRLRGNTHLSGLEFRPKEWVGESDVLVVHFDEHGNQQEFVKDYFIQRNGKVYTLRKNGTKNFMTLNKQNGYFTLTLKEKDANGKSIQIKPRQTFLQCTSYFADYDDWKDIMQNRCKGEYAEVDHVLQKNEPNVDIQCLDLVTRAENLNRRDLDPKNTETMRKSGEGRGKPFTITIQEVGKDDIVLNATSGPDGIALLEQQGITISDMTIRRRLNKKYDTDYKRNGKTIIFKYTEEFLEDQKDIPGEIWRTEKDWNLAEEIKKEFENKKRGPPKAISNFGRIKTNQGKVTYGTYVSDGVHTYNNVGVHRLIGLAFNDHPEKDPNRQGYTPEKTVVRHINDHELQKRGIDVEKKNRTVVIDGVKRRVLSNHIDTLEFGTQKENMQDLSKDKKNKSQQNPMNEFSVTPLLLRENLPKFNRTFHSVPEFLEFVEEQKINITFDDGNVRNALKGKRKYASGYEFTYVKSRVETQ